ncbi:MAG: hypothetical protein Q8O94_00085, partial [bacterium]|nr:hypothetical protein [bacterium]
MTTPAETEIIQEVEVIAAAEPIETAPIEAAPAAHTQNARGGRGSLRGRSARGGSRTRPPRERGEFEQVTIDARRVARVMAGGR